MADIDVNKKLVNGEDFKFVYDLIMSNISDINVELDLIAEVTDDSVNDLLSDVFGGQS